MASHDPSPAREDDVRSPESIIRASYALISGRAGEARDWPRLRALYAPGARLIPIERGADGTEQAVVMTIDGWIASRTPLFAREDIVEYEIGREEHRFGRLAHVWSRYELARSAGADPIRRGVNSIQLWDDGARWWILSVAWDAIAAANL